MKRVTQKSLELASLIKEWILSSDSRLYEKENYNLPFIYLHNWICYINPKEDGVDVAFINGHLMKKSAKHLLRMNRKKVRSLFINDLDSYSKSILKELINEAIEIDATKNR